MNPTNTADIFEMFRDSTPGRGNGGALAVQDRRLREIAVSRQIPFYEKNPSDLQAKLARLSPKDREYVLARLAAGQPAAVEVRSGSASSRQVWFPVQITTPTPADHLAAERARGTTATQTNIQASQTRLQTLLDGRQAGPGTLLSVVGGAYGTSMVGK